MHTDRHENHEQKGDDKGEQHAVLGTGTHVADLVEVFLGSGLAGDLNFIDGVVARERVRVDDG